MNVIAKNAQQSSEGTDKPLEILCKRAQLLCEGWNYQGREGGGGQRTKRDRGNRGCSWSPDCLCD